MTKLESKELAEKIAKLIYEKKGEDIVLLNMEGLSILCDYFVIASGSSRPHNRAIINYIDEEFKHIVEPSLRHIQGKTDGGWIVIDYGTVMVHLFLENLRSYYKLEKLWGKAEMTRPDFTSDTISTTNEINETKEELV